MFITFLIYQDFYSYKTGVYKHMEGELMGAHAVKVIGFGKLDDGTKYWICEN
jgi:cathepsin B